MPNAVIQHSFHAGEWAPALNARVDLQKYHSAAALVRNFYVDYRGGVSTRMGTKYVIQCYNPNAPVRLIPFQASFTVNYALEFGEGYIRFVNNGAPVLEGAKAITGATQANPTSMTAVGHGYNTGDWVYITSVGGMIQLNGRYFRVVVTGANTFTLQNLLSVAIDSTAYTAYTAGGTAQRVYTIPSPYTGAELALIKFAQNVNTLVLCHPNHPPYVLTLITAANWTLNPILFGASIQAPTGVAAATTIAGTANYAYVVTAVDANGQESGPSAYAPVASGDIILASITHSVTWTAVSGAVSYNVYRANQDLAAVVPAGAAFGFVGNVTGTTFVVSRNDPGVVPNFDETPPIAQNPFQGAGVASFTVTNPGTYTTVPTVTVANAPAGGQTATAVAILQVQGTPAVVAGGTGFSVGQLAQFPNGVVLVVASVGGAGAVTAFQPITYPGANPGSITSGATPANPVTSSTGGSSPCTVNLTWGVGQVQVVTGGSGYVSAPAVTFSAGAAAAIAVLGSASNGNPTVPIYFDQRLVLSGPAGSPQQFNMSKPTYYYNFDITNPIQSDDAIQGTLVSGQLNTIKSMISMPSGLVMLSDRQAWLVNGGSAGAAITPIDVTGHAQAYNGASDVYPIVANYDILYVQAKGSIVRDLTYNFYTNVYTGTDISVLSSHLFYNYTISGWAFAEEPFKTVWAVRNDGTLLSLCFVKEQEVIGWAHSDTNGFFKSVATITETVPSGTVDATYAIVQRNVAGGSLVQYIERFAERNFTYGLEDAWCVDSALQSAPSFGPNNPTSSTLTVSAASGVGVTFTFSGSFALTNTNIGNVIRVGGGIGVITSVSSGNVCLCTITQAITAVNPYSGIPAVAQPGTWSLWLPATTFSGGEHLQGLSVTGLADGVEILAFTMPASGSFTLGSAATKVTVGLAYLPQLQTLPLDLGEPTIQGNMKKIPEVTVRVQDTLGLSIGSAFGTALVAMKDLVLGNVGSASNAVVTGLVTGDARTIIDPSYTVPGQYCIQQSHPFPATILGVIPKIETPSRK